VLATGPKSRRFESSQGDEFLRMIKIHSTPSFGWEVKPKVTLLLRPFLLLAPEMSLLTGLLKHWWLPECCGRQVRS
jgi:hypothetical protein